MKVNKFLAAIFLASSGTFIQAQPANNADAGTMAGRLIRYDVKPGQLAAFKIAVSDYVLYSLSLENNILSEAYYEEENASVLWIIERWNNRKAADEANTGAQFKAIVLLAENALVTPAKTFYVKDLEPLSKTEWRRGPGEVDKPVTIMLFVDSKAGTEDNFKKVYHAAMPQFRSEQGVINYQLSQLQDDSTRFVTYEKFRNEDAFQFHLAFPPIQPVLDYLNTSIKKQPFQAGLHRLIAFTSYNQH